MSSCNQVNKFFKFCYVNQLYSQDTLPSAEVFPGLAHKREGSVNHGCSLCMDLSRGRSLGELRGLGRPTFVRDRLALPEPPSSPGQAGHSAPCGRVSKVAGWCMQHLGFWFSFSSFSEMWVSGYMGSAACKSPSVESLSDAHIFLVSVQPLCCAVSSRCWCGDDWSSAACDGAQASGFCQKNIYHEINSLCVS